MFVVYDEAYQSITHCKDKKEIMQWIKGRSEEFEITKVRGGYSVKLDGYRYYTAMKQDKFQGKGAR